LIASTISSDVRDSRLVGTAEPERVDRGIGDHVADGFVRPRLADIVLARERRRRSGVFFVWTPDATHVRIAHGRERLDVEAGVEAAADESDSEAVAAHIAVPPNFSPSTHAHGVRRSFFGSNLA